MPLLARSLQLPLPALSSTHTSSYHHQARLVSLSPVQIAVRVAQLSGIAAVWMLVIWNIAMKFPTTDRSISIPHSVADLKVLAVTLKAYSSTHFSHVLGLFSIVFLFKQAFRHPRISALEFVGCKTRIMSWRSAIDEQKDNLLPYLISIRTMPVVPGWFVNLASPFVGIPIGHFFISTAIGLTPFHYICVQAARTLSTLDSMTQVLNIWTLLQLVMITAVVIAPVVLKKRFALLFQSISSGGSMRKSHPSGRSPLKDSKPLMHV
ncbi:hypothetical protein BASA62_000541 [Batrachochytrium salamandrivorans]|nr:hypothetical protein BASA62_000541 [Batrachochytrium salamandrivorans]